MDNRFENRRVIITGAGSGIGQATSLRLVAEGAAVVACDVHQEGLDRTAERARTTGPGSLSTHVVDVSDESSVTECVGAATEELGGIDILVNAAGILRSAHTHELSLKEWNRIIGVNLTGTFLMIRDAIPALKVSGRGVIVNFSSTSATFAHPYMAAYAASKGGIWSLTHTVAAEYAKDGIRAVSVAPGSISSGMTAAPGLPSDADLSHYARVQPVIEALPSDADLSIPGMAGPEAVAGVIAMLASDDGAFITGTEIRIDGGAHM
ncbi:SDR family oxidoreductase [Gordonia pseudamarae]|uniref:SDR family oxidoreductase n=1 Tax=Gordonia pseudamarae TaxID=2831662 RepID=A0ABX6IME2_9ACTN|nr:MULTISPECIES: SDR family NAD(P)-dependent oxidoreductase [Gordonia]MBD0022199.1 SDR family oxidoreductase [Gordonia sp. (in: high G+C Gram-positive bacteria)]QHN28214.1 SDR family oxidoreductase [Gordonia pseudamarae]QHN37074.1 SDR family oxidoreductase [Gordonia pseudamarae]